MRELLREIERKLPDTEILENEPLARHTTFRIGGPADVLLQPGSAADVPGLVRLVRASGLNVHLMGGGSNLLVSDGGVRGAVVKLCGGAVSRDGETRLLADAGCSKAAVAVFAQREGLTGLEFLHGIPGTLGGGVMMNAGAYGGECARVVERVTACGEDGALHIFSAGDAEFSYRHSIFAERRDLTILSVELALQPGDPGKIRADMEDLMARRREKQPLEYPSAGSTFKRPAGYFAGKLIEDSGLKGYAVGGACVSEKHAGFVINRGGATCEDVRRVIEHVKETVLRTFGVELECELEMW